MKKILLSVLTVMLLVISSLSLSADAEAVDEYSFLEIVERTKYYKDYQNQIIEREVLREADTEYGKRFTVQYSLSSSGNSQNNLIIIGDGEGNILVSMIVYSDENILTTINLAENSRTSVYLNAKGPVYLCEKYVCTRYESRLGIHEDYGCSTLIGQGCNPLSALGKPWIVLLCKAGVWIACKLSYDKVCVEYYEELSVCELWLIVREYMSASS